MQEVVKRMRWMGHAQWPSLGRKNIKGCLARLSWNAFKEICLNLGPSVRRMKMLIEVVGSVCEDS